MIDELRTAVYNIGSAVTGLTGGFWYVEADQAKDNSYAVFTFITSTESRDTGNKFPKIFLQISIYDVNALTCETLTKRFRAAFDDSEASFSLASYEFIRIELNFQRGLLKPGEKFISVLQYEIDLQKK